MFLPIFSFAQIGYNPVTVQFSKPFRVTTGAASGKVLTSSADGVITLQTVTGVTGATGVTSSHKDMENNLFIVFDSYEEQQEYFKAKYPEQTIE